MYSTTSVGERILKDSVRFGVCLILIMQIICFNKSAPNGSLMYFLLSFTLSA
jgi:hypothetical protein